MTLQLWGDLPLRLTLNWTLHGRELALDGTPVASACTADNPVERLVRSLPAAYDLPADRTDNCGTGNSESSARQEAFLRLTPCS